MVSSPFHNQPVASGARKRFSYPAYTNRILFTGDQEAEHQCVNYESDSVSLQSDVVRPQLRTEDEAELRLAVTSLYQQADRNKEVHSRQKATSPETYTATSEPGVRRTRSKRGIALDTLSSLSCRLSVLVEPTEFASDTRQDNDFLQFNGLLYIFEFGSPLSRSSRVFEAGKVDAGDSQGRFSLRDPSVRSKKSRYSWGGFDLAHRNKRYSEDQDDLIAILENDEMASNDIATAAPIRRAPSPEARRTPSPSRSHYGYQNPSGTLEDEFRPDSIAVGATVSEDFTQRNTNITTNTRIDNGHLTSTDIPASTITEQSKIRKPRRKRDVVRRVSDILFGRWKDIPAFRTLKLHHHHVQGNVIRV